VLYARYRGVEVSSLLPSMGAVYVDSAGVGRLVHVYVVPGAKAVFLEGPREDVSRYRRVFKVVFEWGGYDSVVISPDGKRAEAILELKPVIEALSVPVDLEHWGKATSPPHKPVKL